MKLKILILLAIFTCISFVHSEEKNDVKYNDLDKSIRSFSKASLSITNENIERAKQDAEELLKISSNYKENWNYGNILHHANIVLGRVALFKKDFSSAEESLLKAAQVKGSPQLNSFGPNMSLAKELLENNKKEVVLKYIDNCLAFWNNKQSVKKAKEWKKVISAGSIPNFKGNLYY